MKQVLVHIGTGKTGTTSIQHTLRRAFKEGKLEKIAYPDISGSSHNGIADAYRHPGRLPRVSKHRYRSELSNNTFAAFTTGVRSDLERWVADNDSIVLSGEYFSGLSESEIRRFCEDLERWGVARVRVLVYVRHPSAYYLSFIQQQLKGNHLVTQPEAFKYGFRESIERWQAVAPDVVVRPFERSTLTGNDVVPDFLREVSAFFDEAIDVGRVEIIRKNESISAEGMLILQKYRFLFHRARKNVPMTDARDLLDILAESQAVVTQTKAEIDPAVAHVIAERHREDIDWLKERFQIDFASGGAGQQGEGHAAGEGRRMSGRDLKGVLESYDEGILEELLFFCLHQALTA